MPKQETKLPKQLSEDQLFKLIQSDGNHEANLLANGSINVYQDVPSIGQSFVLDPHENDVIHFDLAGGSGWHYPDGVSGFDAAHDIVLITNAIGSVTTWEDNSGDAVLNVGGQDLAIFVHTSAADLLAATHWTADDPYLLI